VNQLLKKTLEDQGQILKNFLNFRKNLQTCPKAWLHAFIAKAFGQNFGSLLPKVLL
jgi:hypothetical protein